jgi:hypothetical protein
MFSVTSRGAHVRLSDIFSCKFGSNLTLWASCASASRGACVSIRVGGSVAQTATCCPTRHRVSFLCKGACQVLDRFPTPCSVTRDLTRAPVGCSTPADLLPMTPSGGRGRDSSSASSSSTPDPWSSFRNAWDVK